MKNIFFICALLLITSCSSTPSSNYYLLRAKAVEALAQCNCSIGIGPVTVAEYLNRPQITLSGEPGELTIEQYQRWGEPLRNNIERVLVENLSILADSNDLVIHPWRQDQKPRYAVRINILTMNRQSGNAVLKAQWRIVDTDSNTVLITQLTNYSSALENDNYRNLAEGFSDTLLQLSSQIARAVTQTDP